MKTYLFTFLTVLVSQSLFANSDKLNMDCDVSAIVTICKKNTNLSSISLDDVLNSAAAFDEVRLCHLQANEYKLILIDYNDLTEVVQVTSNPNRAGGLLVQSADQKFVFSTNAFGPRKKSTLKVSIADDYQFVQELDCKRKF